MAVAAGAGGDFEAMILGKFDGSQRVFFVSALNDHGGAAFGGRIPIEDPAGGFVSGIVRENEVAFESRAKSIGCLAAEIPGAGHLQLLAAGESDRSGANSVFDEAASRVGAHLCAI